MRLQLSRIGALAPAASWDLSDFFSTRVTRPLILALQGVPATFHVQWNQISTYESIPYASARTPYQSNSVAQIPKENSIPRGGKPCLNAGNPPCIDVYERSTS